MSPTRRPARVLALTGTTALALGGLVGVAGPAAADARSIDPACAGNTSDAGFVDIAPLPAATEDAVNCLVAYGLTEGVGGDRYAPTEGVERYEMALFLYRELAHVASTNTAVALPEGAGNTFTDIGHLSEEARTAIDALVAADVTDGKDAVTFDPHAVVTRLDMASFVTRVQDYLADQLDDPSVAYDPDAAEQSFPDVTEATPRAEDVYDLVGAGIVQGAADGTYRPGAPVRRDEMALFLTRHLADNIEGSRSLAVGEDVVWNSTQVVSYDDLGDAVAAAGPDELLVAMGEFTEAERMVLDDDGVALTGRGETTVHGSFEIRGADGVVLDGLVVRDYVTAAGVTAGVYLADATGVEITDNVFVGGTEDAYAGRGVENETGGAAEEALLAGNEFFFNLTGVFANPSADFTVQRNAFQDNGAGSGNDTATVLRDNVFDGNAEGVGLGAAGSTVVSNHFVTNDVHVADYTRSYSLETLQAANDFAAPTVVEEGASADLIVDTEAE